MEADHEITARQFLMDFTFICHCGFAPGTQSISVTRGVKGACEGGASKGWTSALPATSPMLFLWLQAKSYNSRAVSLENRLQQLLLQLTKSSSIWQLSERERRWK